ncbi:MAG TPA: response regulator [Burkholderiaceae bacterium]
MSQPTALVIDDSRSARFALRKSLESHGFATDATDSARAAYEWLNTRTPDLIFLDHVMPGEDGLEALRQIKANPKTAAIPVIICSSNDGADFIKEARGHGALDVLQKPPTPQQLQRVLQRVEPDASEPPAPARSLKLAAAASAAVSAVTSAVTSVVSSAVGSAAAAAQPAASAVPGEFSAELARLQAQHQNELAALRQHFDAELKALREQLAKDIKAAQAAARDEAVAQLRETLLRALK